MKHKLLKTIDNISKIRFLSWMIREYELCFGLYFFLPFLFLPISVILGETFYKIVFVVINAFFVFISILKSKKLFIKRDLIAIGIFIFFFAIDFLFRKNTLTLSIYFALAKVVLGCYYFNRITDYKKALKYLSVISKIVLAMFLFDPMLDYYFTTNYMGYGSVMLPSFIAIYVYHILEKKDLDILLLIVSFVFIFVCANRTCLLAIGFLVLLTFRIILKDIKKNKRAFCFNSYFNKSKLSRLLIFIIIFGISFGVNYMVSKNVKKALMPEPVDVLKQSEIDDNNELNNDNGIGNNSSNSDTVTSNDNISNSDTVTSNDNISNQEINNNEQFEGPTKTKKNSYSYSIDKYKQILKGDFSRLLSGRIPIYKKAISVIKNDVLNNPINLLFGRGIGYFMFVNEGVYSHLIFFDIFIEFGALGLVSFLIILGLCLYKYKKCYKDYKIEYLILTFCLVIVFPKLLLSSYFTKELTLFIFIYFIFFLYPITFRKRKKEIK